MADFRDMLGIARAPTGAAAGGAAKASKKSKKRKDSRPRSRGTGNKRSMDGLQRELMALTDGNPPIAPTTSRRVLKKGVPGEKRVAWEWVPFTTARTDAFQLHHWSRKAETRPYPFLKFNKQTQLVQYTDQEYAILLEDPLWTKEQTDTLMDYCRRFDLRFVVIADRFPFQGFKTDDLKDRYYTCATRVLQHRADEARKAQSMGIVQQASATTDISEHPLIRMPFDKEYELERKRQFERIYHRTFADVANEEYLLQEVKRIEQSYKKQQKERVRILKLTQLALSNKPYQDMYMIDDEDDGKKGSRKRASVGVNSRSKMPLPINQKTAARLQSAFQELGINPDPTPSASILEAFEDVKRDILVLLGMQRQAEKREYEFKVLHARKAMLERAKAQLQQAAQS